MCMQIICLFSAPFSFCFRYMLPQNAHPYDKNRLFWCRRNVPFSTNCYLACWVCRPKSNAARVGIKNENNGTHPTKNKTSSALKLYGLYCSACEIQNWNCDSKFMIPFLLFSSYVRGCIVLLVAFIRWNGARMTCRHFVFFYCLIINICFFNP